MPTIKEIRQQFPMYDDVPDRELVRGLHKAHYEDMPYPDFLKAIDFSERVDPTKDMSGVDKFNAGMGKAFTDIGRGAAQLVGSGPSGQEVRDQKSLDAPLMNTGAGMTGNIAGNVAAIAPAALLPGAAAIPAAGALGATGAALQPTEGTGERLGNMALGGGLGAGMQFAGSTGAQMLGQRQGAMQAAEKSMASRNAVRDQTLKAGQEAGYVVPPSSVNPSWINKRLESVAGKAAVGQEASLQNQQVTDSLARRSAGLGGDEALSETALSGARKTAAEPYRQVAATSPQAAADLEAWKTANHEAKLQWNFYNRTGNPDAYKAAQAAQLQSENALQNIEKQAGNNPQLVQALKDSRVQIAKVHSIENAANVGTGSVDASVLGRALDRGAPLSGDLKTIGKFQQAFPQYTRDGSRIPTPGVGKTEALSSALLAGAVHPAAGVLPFVSGPTRSLLLSKPYQKMMAKPNYKASMLTGPGEKLPLPQQENAQLARMLMLPAAANQ